MHFIIYFYFPLYLFKKKLIQWTKNIFYEKNDEPSMSKYKQKINKQNKNKTIIQTLLLISSIPQIKSAVDKNVSSNFNAFMNQDGISQTNKLPNHLINDLKGLTDQTKFESMLLDHHIQTSIIGSDSSIICTPYEEYVLPETFQPLLKQKKINDIAGELKITHTGMTNCETIDTRGRVVKLKRKGYLIPGLPHQLLTPQNLVWDLPSLGVM